LANHILDVTRIESQSLKLNKQKFDLDEVLSYVVADFKNEIRKNNSAVNIYYEPAQELTTGLTIEADRERVIQVISNLISNAIMFTQQGTISVSARVITGQQAIGAEQEQKYGASQELEKVDGSYLLERKEDKKYGFVDAAVRKREEEETVVVNEGRTRGNWVLVSIKDTGSGIDPDIVSKLFSKFTTKSLKGTGLGLFICKNIVEAHGGKIWAENNSHLDGIVNGNGIKGTGATFYFTLPINNDQ
jgi:signal transduction histidine kinase